MRFGRMNLYPVTFLPVFGTWLISHVQPLLHTLFTTQNFQRIEILLHMGNPTFLLITLWNYICVFPLNFMLVLVCHTGKVLPLFNLQLIYVSVVF